MTLIELIQKIGALRIVVVGDPMLDRYVFGEAHRLSPEAPVPIVEVGSETFAAGGAANVAVNVANLGAFSTIIIAPRGMDGDGLTLENLLRRNGVETIHMWPSKAPTAVKTRVIAAAQQICRIDREGPPDGYAPSLEQHWTEIEESLRQCDACIISDYAKGSVTDDLVDRIKELREETDLFIAFDPCSRSKIDCSEMDLLTPNREEAYAMVRDRGLDIDVKMLFDLIHGMYAPRALAITLGAAGIAVGSEGWLSDTLPAEAKEVFDVSGAGDTVIAVMTLAMAAGAPMEIAAELANMAAGCVIRKVGTSPVTLEELKREIAGSGWEHRRFDRRA